MLQKVKRDAWKPLRMERKQNQTEHRRMRYGCGETATERRERRIRWNCRKWGGERERDRERERGCECMCVCVSENEKPRRGIPSLCRRRRML